MTGAATDPAACVPRRRAPTHWLAQVDPGSVPGVDRLPDRAEVVVVGGGVAGVSAAYWLARLGAGVLLLESRRLGWGATGRNAGIMLAGQSPLEDPTLLREVLREEEIDAEYQEPGHLALARTSAIWERMLREVEVRPATAPPLHVLEPAACEELLGLRIAPDFLGGRWLPGGAVVHPARFLYGIARAAARRGALVATGTPVLSAGPAPLGGGVRVETARGTVRAQHVVLACSARSPLLRRRMGRVVTPVRGQVLATRPMRRVFRMGLAVDWGTLYWRQAADGAVVLGGYRNLDPAGETGARETLHPRIQEALEHFLPEAFPGLGPVAAARRWAGIMDETADGRPVVGRWPDGSGVWVSAGFGGHGLPPALGVGRALARAVVRDGAPEGMDRLDPARFKESLR